MHEASLESLKEELEEQHLGIDKWLLFGGSWGVTLSLAYALAHPHRVTAMILRGVCTMRQQEIDWMYGGGAGVLKPWAWQRFLDHLDLEERQAPLLSYYRRLLSPDASCRDAAARSWMEWEMSVGFDSRGQLLDWDGSQWSSLNFPATSPPRTPPRPSRSASSSAPATASAQRMASSREYRLETRVRRAGPPPQPAPTTVPDERLSSLLEFGLSYSGDPGMSTSTAQALLECHYSVHGAFLRGQHNPISTPSSPQAEMSSGKAVVHGPRRGPRSSRAKSGPDHDAPLLERVHALRHIPAIAVHGQMDLVCPPTTAFELHRAWPELQLRLVPGALHSMYDPAITHELVEATTLMYDVVKQA
ncbi:hypothetical protein PLESTM_001118300 [Pleodorina starrii]|nr:hypothetical protein PLESTM_001118300 [Pleodorina starrii]